MSGAPDSSFSIFLTHPFVVFSAGWSFVTSNTLAITFPSGLSTNLIEIFVPKCWDCFLFTQLSKFFLFFKVTPFSPLILSSFFPGFNSEAFSTFVIGLVSFLGFFLFGFFDKSWLGVSLSKSISVVVFLFIFSWSIFSTSFALFL